MFNQDYEEKEEEEKKFLEEFYEEQNEIAFIQSCIDEEKEEEEKKFLEEFYEEQNEIAFIQSCIDEEKEEEEKKFLEEFYEQQYVNKESIYYKQIHKRYNERKNSEGKCIYMLEIFNKLIDAIKYLDDSVNYYSDYSDYIHSAKEIIDDLIERLTKEIDQENIYNINSESGLELLEELNILNDDYLMCINTENEFPDIDIILCCKQKAESIIKDFIDAKDNKYKNNKSKQYIKLKEIEIKQKKEKDPTYLSLRERQKQMNDLREKGYSYKDIASRVNITKQGVWKHFNKLK